MNSYGECSVEKFLLRYNKLKNESKTKESVMAKEMGFSRNRPFLWRKNKIFPTLPILIKLAQYFFVPIEYLIGRVDKL